MCSSHAHTATAWHRVSSGFNLSLRQLSFSRACTPRLLILRCVLAGRVAASTAIGPTVRVAGNRRGSGDQPWGIRGRRYGGRG
ncbi:hypothetical protein BC936DRAFT_140069 [Jimgerdemannia flammicorona]|uniref:Uncharacterized protein n=1 Tax=Jimgerdemannia flammicorona TaxID=994334 RepID=A0A433B336_9FUNG|nr:hypothetical protein BC936DRAFT_140069 [Jimgerdemannia flammicorona]